MASKRTPRVLAALVWLTGGAVLLYAGAGYLATAAALRPGSPLPWGAGALATLLGLVRGRRTFARACRRNLDRIDGLARPRPWDAFRPGFYVALAAMIGGGAALRAAAEAGGFGAAVVVGGLELVIAFALLASSVEFRRGGGRPTEGPLRRGRLIQPFR